MTKRSGSWAVKYRPKNFSEIVGQNLAVKKLRGMLKSETVPNALLITGGTGSGKTTLARMFAYYLNCETTDGCGKCSSCKSGINSHPDIKELNAGTEGGVDDVKNLITLSKLRPRNNVRTIIYDECHLLTPKAVQNLLKPIEEPPEGTLWVMATTNPEKLPSAVVGRCQQIELAPVKAEDVVKRLKQITEFEKLDYLADKHLMTVAESTGGQVRNAIQLLEGINFSVLGGKKFNSKKLDSLITENIDASGQSIDNMATKVLMTIYLKKTNVLCKTLAEMTDPLQLVNKLLYLNQYLIDKSVGSASHNVWHSVTNKRFYATLEKNIPKFIKGKDMLCNTVGLHMVLTDLRSQMQDFAVDARSLVTAHLAQHTLDKK